MDGLKAMLECVHQVNIDLGYYEDEDVWDVEIGDKVECEICDNGIKLKVNENCWSARFKPSILQKYFKIIG